MARLSRSGRLDAVLRGSESTNGDDPSSKETLFPLRLVRRFRKVSYVLHSRASLAWPDLFLPLRQHTKMKGGTGLATRDYNRVGGSIVRLIRPQFFSLTPPANIIVPPL